ncbi:phytase [Confluentibacter citreus]|uniref:phytase n=1 Tax=Confluentibacter citreus TaxID=2007307 RepID=UPI000C2841D6|nr:phytase [Confluentibacter citreus]
MINHSLKPFLIFTLISLVFSCNTNKLLEIYPDIISEKSLHDTDDPAIWVNYENPEQSIVFGTDKDTDGAIYAYDLNGKIIESKTIRGLKRPNNVDIRQGFKINDSVTMDIMSFTERERGQIRLFSVPDMRELDNGGFPVFEDETNQLYRLPMGISLYKSPKDGSLYAIVGRKDGPSEGYLYQYKIEYADDKVALTFIRKFGKYSGKKEIEAIAVDDALGYVYYSDETFGIRKYYAEPAMGNEEISVFGGDTFKRDNEGIAIVALEGKKGYIIVSNQQAETFNIFSRETNAFIKQINLTTKQTDGCDVVATPLNDTFKSGLFVAMNEEQNFYFYDLGKLGLEE